MVSLCHSSKRSVAGALLRLAILLCWCLGPWCSAVDAGRLNVLLLTADDMNHNSLGFAGCPLPGVTPHLDRLASQSLSFERAHVTVAVCQPSRQCLLTGRYPHRNGSVGFYPVFTGVPTLAEILKDAGFYLGILGKAIHLRPVEKFPWHDLRDEGVLGKGRNPQKYYEYSREFFLQAKREGKPFFLMANSHDPHRPFAGSEGSQALNYPAPIRMYQSEEVKVPGFLPDLPEVRKELAQYYSSVNRCDQTMGEILRALDESGLADKTLVLFLSDNGMAMPFAKSNCYLHSTRTPWLVRWPGVVKPGVDRTHAVSGIDYMPTILEALGLPLPEGMDGRSFLAVLRGHPQEGRDQVVTCYNEAFGNKSYPMRCLQNERFGYIYNSWADGKKRYHTEGMSGLTFKAMQQESASDQALAERVELLTHRVSEELYDFAADPDALHNLIDDPRYAGQRKTMRAEMLSWMKKTTDPLLVKFQKLCELAASQKPNEIFLAQGLMSGEVTQDSVFLQTRFTAVPAMIGGKVPGIAGVGRFEYSTDPEFRDAKCSEWYEVGEKQDFILRAAIKDLKPQALYYFRAVYGCDRQQLKTSDVAEFKTRSTAEQSTSLDFVLTSCLNYAFFQDASKRPHASREDRQQGYPALVPILQQRPDFLIINGDCVYYDHPYKTRAKTLEEMRDKWHEQYAMPRFVTLFAKTPVYWNKDDHDYRQNDSDTTGDDPPSHELGIATFREQVPVAKNDAPTYRTHRMGRDLQLWFVEGRDYRSPNRMPDGPQKSIWGKEQRDWLQRTIKESDATFKILISPTPLIGPDDASKSDNHANEGFRHEGESFFHWMKVNGVDPSRFVILCGDRHWKYHTRHPLGFQEFSCGALNRENARVGRKPGTKGSSDPEGRLTQFYTDATPQGGYLDVHLHVSDKVSAKLEIHLRDDHGKILYQHQIRQTP
ncbi:MAG: sulfatase-like hydrolase/transferase [Akkermansiaceae bacterium]